MSKIPQTDSIEELAQFWETHSPLDFLDELELVEEPVFVRKGGQCLRVVLPAEDAEALCELAASRGVQEGELVREWVSERLHAS